jgi:dienelactone hydrolase
VLHGAHGFCLPPSRPRAWPCAAGNEDPNHLGLVWLTEALAAAGFVAVAPGVNAAFAGSEANALDGPAERVAAIVRRDVTGPLQRGEHLVDWLEPSGIDLEHVVVIGHSRGGAVAAVLGRAPELAVGAPPRATVMIAPTSDTVDPSTLVDRPTAVLLGTCDGDTGVDGGEFVSAALGQARRSPIALVMAEGALHNATNSRLDDELMPDGRPGCEPGARLEDEAQRVRYGRIVPEMARALLGLAASPPIGEALLAPTRPDDRAAPALRLVHVDPAAARTRLVSPLQGWPVPGVEVAGFAVIACPGGLTSAFRAPGTEDCHRGELQEVVGRPPGIRLAWRGPGARMRLAAPAATPAVLVLRVIADPLSLPAGVSVRLRVAAGSWASDLTIPVPTVGDPIPPSGVRRGAVLWSERRVVLPPTSEVEITVESPGAGAVEVVGIDLVELPTLAASAPAAP